MTLEDLRNIVQASDAELEAGLRKAKVLNLNGTLRPLPASSLLDVLVTLLLTITSRGLPRPPRPIPLQELINHLDDDFQVNPAVTEHIASWYGIVDGAEGSRMWEADVKSIVGDIGIGLLRKNAVSGLLGFAVTDSEPSIRSLVRNNSFSTTGGNK